MIAHHINLCPNFQQKEVEWVVTTKLDRVVSRKMIKSQKEFSYLCCSTISSQPVISRRKFKNRKRKNKPS